MVICLLYKICAEDGFCNNDENYLDEEIIVDGGGSAPAKNVKAPYSPEDPGKLEESRKSHNILGKLADHRKRP